MKRTILPLILIPATIALGGYFVEKQGWFAPAKQALRSQSVPTAILDYGSFGKIIKQMGVVKAVVSENRPLGQKPHQEDQEEVIIFSKKRQVGDYEFQANPGGGADLPSSRIITGNEFKPGWPLISIVIDEKEFFNHRNGLKKFPRARGREWERLAYVSYFEDGKLLFASGAGLRLHGGSGRSIKNRISYRLYFRKEYGANRFTPGIFSPATDPLKRLVVHVDWPQDKPFTTCLAFDIARRLGCVVPEVKPAMLYLNGKPKGIFFLSEHVSVRQWRVHFNHDEFLFYKYRSRADSETLTRFSELEAWSKSADAPLTMSEVAERVDIDNLSRNLFSYVFCGTDDWIQGVAALDLKKPDSRWFWINWDMDRSFWFQHGSRAGVKAEDIWEKYAFEFVLNPGGKNVRTVLFRRLVSESPEYREYFVRLVTDLMNHAINEEFLLSRVDHYRRLAVSYGRKNLKSLNMMSRFCKYRPDYIRRQMRDYFNLGEAFLCRITGESDIKLEIDGYRANADYRGWYFNGQAIEVRIVDPMDKKFSHWLVNGKQVPDPVLRWTVETETTIEPVFLYLP